MSLWLSNLRKLALEYVKSCACWSGGYCFYRLEEPNASDTYHAVATIALLDGRLEDQRTLEYLLELQDVEGSFASPFTACHVIKTLALMGERPRRNPAGYLLSQIESFGFDPENQPAETISIFNRLFFLVDAVSVLGLEINAALKENICRFVLTFREKDRGFGHIRSTLLETAQALKILAQLAFPVASLAAADFIRACETPLCGFTGVPNTSLSYIEQVHAGLVACEILCHQPRYLDACVAFIRHCQNGNGGFSRRKGISSLENTYYAIHSLALLSALKRL